MKNYTERRGFIKNGRSGVPCIVHRANDGMSLMWSATEFLNHRGVFRCESKPGVEIHVWRTFVENVDNSKFDDEAYAWADDVNPITEEELDYLECRMIADVKDTIRELRDQIKLGCRKTKEEKTCDTWNELEKWEFPKI